MKVSIVLFGVLFIAISCDNKKTSKSKENLSYVKDTLDGEFIINQLDLGKFEVSFFDKFQQEKEEFKSGDTFYVDTKYIGEPKKLRSNHEILLNYTSENLEVLKRTGKGKFAFVIKPDSKSDTVLFDFIIKSEKYLFKDVNVNERRELEDIYIDYYGLGRYFIVYN